MEKKKFLKPEAEIIDFQNSDIITVSGGTDRAAWVGDEDFTDPEE